MHCSDSSCSYVYTFYLHHKFPSQHPYRYPTCFANRRPHRRAWRDVASYSVSLYYSINTSTSSGDLGVTSRSILELFLTSLDDLVYNINIDLSKFSSKVRVDHSVQFTKNFTQLGVEMILDAIIASWLFEVYFPGRRWDITDHLFPISL